MSEPPGGNARHFVLRLPASQCGGELSRDLQTLAGLFFLKLTTVSCFLGEAQLGQKEYGHYNRRFVRKKRVAPEDATQTRTPRNTAAGGGQMRPSEKSEKERKARKAQGQVEKIAYRRLISRRALRPRNTTSASSMLRKLSSGGSRRKTVRQIQTSAVFLNWQTLPWGLKKPLKKKAAAVLV